MKSRWFTRAAVTAVFLFGTGGFAEAITWNFTGSGGVGSFGNVRTFTSEGITVTATAWSYNGTGFQAARLGLSSAGLGVCSELERCGGVNNQVDNAGQNEFVLFQFSAAVDPLVIQIDPFDGTRRGAYDRDVSYWTGTVALPSDRLAGETYASLGGLGFGSRIDNNGTVSSGPRDVSITSLPVTAMLFGAVSSGSIRALSSGSGNDAFMIARLTGTASVPEPSSLLLLGSGLAGIGIWRRKFSKG